nr:hypothetical protein [Tanacetum cinerariifolium]
MCDMVGQYIQKKEEKQIEEEQAAKARYWKILVCYDDDDDDEDYTITIIPKEPDNSLNIPKEIYSKPLFYEEIFFMKIDPYHFNVGSDLIESLLNHDSLIISSSSKIDSLFDEFTGELTLFKSITPGINETDCDPEEETRLIKIDLSFTPDDPMLVGIEEDDYDSERDILILEELLSNDSLSLPENESFHFDIPTSSRPPSKPPDALVTIDGEDIDWSGHVEEDAQNYAMMAYSSSNSEALKEKEDLKTKFENWQNSSKNLSKLLNTQMSANDKFGLGYGDYRENLEVHPEGNLKQLKTLKVNKPKLEDIPVVREFPGVFLKDLLGLPPSRKVEFHIDLIPGAMPVAKSPYCLAPTKMKEPSNQLKELQEKDKMYYDLRGLYWWPGMKKDIAMYVKFSYNNTHHLSEKCALLQALCGRKCRTPIAWAEVGESKLIGPEIIQETTDKIVQIKESLKTARDRQNNYANNRQKPFEFSVGDKPETSNPLLKIPSPTSQLSHTVSSIKLPILKKEEYDIWAMKMEHYLCHTNYLIWQVIQNRNGPVSITTDTNGTIKVLPPKTAVEVMARERERKARITLLIALHEDHLAKFHKMADANKMWEAIKSRFGGNDESKKMQKYLLKQQFDGFSVSSLEGLHKGHDRFQTLMSKLEIHGDGVSHEDADQKFLRSLPSSWSQVALIMRTKPGLDTLNFDDLYNNLGVFQCDVKGTTASSSNTQNVAFLSADNTSSTNTVSTAYSVSSLSVSKSQPKRSSSYTDEINDDDLEEIDLKWQVAMISMRIKKFHKRTGRKLQFDTKDTVDSRRRDGGYNRNKARDNSRRPAHQDDSKTLVTINGEDIDWSEHVEEDTQNFAMLAYSSSNSGSNNEVQSCSETCAESYATLKKLYDEQRETLGDEALKEKEDLKTKVENWQNSSKNLNRLLIIQMSANDKFGLRYGDYRYGSILSYENEVLQSAFMNKECDLENTPVNDRYAEGMHATSVDESDAKTYENASSESDSSVETTTSMPDPVDNTPKVVKEKEKPSFAFTDTAKHVKTSRENVKETGTTNHYPKIKKKDRHSHTRKGLGYARKSCFVCGKFSHLIRDCDFHKKRMAKQVALTKSKEKGTNQQAHRPVWNNVQRVNHQNKFVPSVLLTKTGKFPVNAARQNFYSQAALTSTASKVNTARPFVNETRPTRLLLREIGLLLLRPQQDDPHKALKDKGIINSRCSRHMTRNKAHLFKGGSVAFGGRNGRITGKGKIKADRLDFEDVYYVEELKHYNLFSVSQMCDKKNKVLFTYTDCLVLSPDFKLPDENQVLLKIPRQHNMYSFNLKNIDPSGDLSCLLVKASIDESNKWHRRLGHVNFKNLNKLVKGNLVRGKGHAWMFNLDYLTKSMNYEPVSLENQANKSAGPQEANNSAGTQDNDDQDANSEEIDLHDEHFVQPIWYAYSTTVKSSEDKIDKNEKPDANTNSTNLLNVISAPVSVVGPSRALNDDEPPYLDDPSMPRLEDIFASPSEGIFTNSSYDDEGVVTDFNNLETTVNTRSKVKKNFEAHALISQALEDESWVDAMQEELLQFQIQKEEGIDYDEVFAHVAKIEAIRIFLAFAFYMGFIVYQMDVKSAFLYGTIDEEVYVTQPLGFVDPKFPNKVNKVVKALYGLHQALRAWYATLSTFLERSGYRRGAIDKTLFIKQDKQDIMLVKQKEDGIFISQDKYVAEILKKFDFLSVKTASTPIETQKPLVKDEEAADVDVYLYRRLILWQCKKQTIVATSTTEAEYVAAAHCSALLKGRLLEVTTAKRRLLLPSIAKPTESEGFEQIIDFLNGSLVGYALKASPTIRTSCIKQFWSTAKVKTIDDEVRVQALIDAKRVTIKESSIHHILRLNDEEGTSCLANDDIFTGLANMGYEKITMASTIIRLATNQKFNFSMYILLSLVKNIEAGVPFYMFPRFVQLLVGHQLGDMSHHQDIYNNPSLTKKVFANMKRVSTSFSRVITPLFENMLVLVAEEVEHQLPSPSNDPIPDANKDSLTLQELMDICTRLSNKVLDLESEVIDIRSSFTDRIQKLEDRVDQLEVENRALKEKSFKTTQVDTTTPVENIEKLFKQGRMIAYMDEDVKVNLEEAQAKAYNLDLQHAEKVLSMQDVDKEEPAEVEEVLEVVKAAKLFTEVVTTVEPTTTAAQIPKASALRRRRGVVIQDPEETAASLIDESFTRQLEAELNANINWNDVVEQVKKSERQNNEVMRYQALKRKPLTEAQVRKNMMIYLKNIVGFKMDFFKGMTYSEIRPLFEKHYNSIQAFLEKEEVEVIVQEKRQGKSLEQEITKKQRMDEDAEELKRHLQIVANDDDDDDDVYTEATSLASKVPVVDYQIHHENNKPYYKIIRADGTHKLFLSFITLLKNFDREDLKTLWKLVKERFETTKPKNFSDDFLLNILKIMFEKPHIEANVWKDQKGKYGLAKQMLDNVRLEVEEESEMSLELLRLVRRELNE